jgi:myo-inositol-hexaphosphate 3-phosphohydrolase/Ca2+-binding RTX toxin-like protein
MESIRFASFNASLNRDEAGELITDLSTPDNEQAQTIAEIIQRNNPDVVLINEFDFDENGEAAEFFQENYLSVAQSEDINSVEYPHVFLAPSNTGISSGFDFNNDGEVGGPGDAFGFGFFPGQFGMLLLSKHPIVEEEVRTFQNFLWKDMPGGFLTDDPSEDDPETEVNENLDGFFSQEEIEVYRLSSKNHWDVPIEVNGETIHILAAHPTPPVFDGPEDLNGKRNHDEIRFWSDYITPGENDYIYDDNGNTGGLEAGEQFVILGDYNADPFDGDSRDNAALQFTENSLINNSVIPSSEGGVDAAERQGGINDTHEGNPAFDTADFNDEGPGNLRVDYALPSANLTIDEASVFWPEEGDPLFDLVGNFDPDVEPTGFPSSDHRLVSVDVSQPVRNSVAGTELLGETNIETGFTFEDTEVGGLSGLVYDAANDVYYAISDDRGSENSNARFYTLEIDLSDGSLDDGDINFTDVTTLLNADGNPFPAGSIDPEGIALTDDNTVYIASEGDASQQIPPFVNEFSLDGEQLSELPVDEKFVPNAEGTVGIRNNLAFESTTISPDGRFLYTATENALQQDGPAADVDQGSISRIVKYDLTTGEAVAEFGYNVDPVPDVPDPEDEFRTNGLVELLAIDNDGTLLALERGFSVGVGNTVKLYEVNTQGALDVSSEDDLFREEPFTDDGETVEPAPFVIDPAVIKEEILDIEADLGIEPDNLEALAFGPPLEDGRPTLIIASDNNFSDGQTTQFITLALDLESIPLAQPTVETPLTQNSADAETPLRGDSDDPAIWVNPNNPDDSLVIATLKDGGAVVFDLQGEVQQTITPADIDESFTFGDIRYNNVDLVYDFELGGESVDLAVFSDRENDTLAIFQINPTTGELTDITADGILETIFGVDDGEATAYGLATYTSPVSGESYAFVTQADGNLVAQLQLNATGNGTVDAEVVRTLELPVPTGDPEDSQSEGLVVDEELGFMYVAMEEEVGILKFSAEPDGGDDFKVIQPLTEQPELTAEPFQNFITFGDSSVDVGNVFLGSDQTIPPSPPYFEGRFSNGPLFVELIAEELGLSASTPFLAGGDNYGFGGAELGDGTSADDTPNIGEQINSYLAENTPTEDDLIFLSAGSNNNFQSADNLPNSADVVSLLTEHLTTLANAGAENFAVANIPPLGNAPLVTSQEDATAINTAISEYNTLLDTELDTLEDSLDIEIYELDLETTLQNIIDDPATFGITNVTDQALDTETAEVVDNPNEFLFWDEIHPTATVGEIIAQDALAVLPSGTQEFTAEERSPFVPDIEGLDLYYSDDGTGYLVASSQGDSTYAVFSREGNNEYLGSFAIGDSNEIDQANESDGLDIINVSLGSAFPEGLVVVQDGANDPQNPVPDEEELENNSTNYKFVPWNDIANSFENPLDINPTSFDPRNPEPNTLPNGVASGDVTQETATLLARSTVPGEISFEVGTSPEFNNIVETLTATVTDINQPAKVQVDGLTADTEYFYRVTDAAGTSEIGEFETAAESGNNGFTFAITGDWQQAPPYPSLKNIPDRDPEVFVQLGDTIYADLETPALPGVSQARELSDFRTKHAEVVSERFGLNTVSEVYQTTPILSTIDDHELVDNFAGGAAPGESPDAPDIGSSDEPLFTDDVAFVNDTQAYENALQAFQEYHPLEERFYDTPDNPRTDGERQLYRANRYGDDAAILVTDARSFRDPQIEPADLTSDEDIARFQQEAFDPNRTMLSEPQLEQLKADLLDAQAEGVTWKFVVIPEPIQNFGLVNAEDRFEGYAAERTELLQFIDENDIENTVFLAGDFHGTIVNNLTYQTAPGETPIPIDAFEIVTGPVAFNDGLFGPTVANLSVNAGLISGEQLGVYNSLPVNNDPDSEVNDRDDFIKQLLNQQIEPLGFDRFGLNDNLDSAEGLVDAELLQGDYVATHTFGWTELDINEETQQLTVTTYGIEPYSEAELVENPEEIVNRTPEIVSQFTVNPTGFEGEESNLRFGSLAADTLEAGINFDGEEDLVFSGAGEDTVEASTGNGGNRLYGGSNNDELIVGRSDRAFGGAGDDTIEASLGGENRLYGGSGNDTVVAGFEDRVSGGDGDDRLFLSEGEIEGGGSNIVTGGAGADQFWIANAQLPANPSDITDFIFGEDVLGIGGIDTVAEFADLSITQDGDDAIVSVGDNDLARLLGINANELTADQFAIQPSAEVA